MAGGLVCYGNLVMDTLVRPVDRIVWNASTWVETLDQRLGGNGASTSYAAALSGAAVRLVSVAGRDAFGDKLLAELSAAGVDVECVARVDGPTPATVVLVNSAGERLFLHRPGAGAAAFEFPEPDAALLGGRSRFHLANLFALPGLRQRAADFLRMARQAGLATSIDTGWDSRERWMEDLVPCLPWTDLLFVNRDEAARLAGTSEIAGAARRLREAGAARVVVKLGNEGCAIFDGAAEFRVPAFEVDAVDTTGAGDCFAGAFLASLERGQLLADAARFANAAAALAVQHLGATAGLRPRDETESWMRTATQRK
jgi:ribokinase